MSRGKSWWQSREPESPFPWGHSYRFLLFCAVHGVPRGPFPKPAIPQECAGGPRSVRRLHPVPHQLRVLRTPHPSQLGGPAPACALPRASASSKALTHSSTQLELSVWGPREAAAQNTGPKLPRCHEPGRLQGGACRQPGLTDRVPPNSRPSWNFRM